MLHKGHAYGVLIRQRYASRYPTPRDIPAELRSDFFKLRSDMDLWYRNAEKLGWRMPSREDEQRYRSIVKAAKSEVNR